MRVGIRVVAALLGCVVVVGGARGAAAQPVKAHGPHPEHAQKLMLFGQFVGDWDLEVVYYPPDGPARTATGSWRFEWALEGRAIQDVWMVPSAAERERTGAKLIGYGTTIRFYDPAIDAWHVTWNGVLTGTTTVFKARQQEDEIVMEAEAQGETVRWIFSEIQPQSFHWRGVGSSDGGRTWRKEQEMVARRRAPGMAADARSEPGLKRRADLGLRFREFASGVGLAIAGVASESPAARAGLRVGDFLVGLGGRPFVSNLDAEARLAAIRSEEPVALEISRSGQRETLQVVFPPQPQDSAEGVEFSYEQVRNPRSALLQRVIVSRPRSARGPLPAVFFIPWLSCDSVEAPVSRRGGIETLLYRIASESGAVLMRVEKPGVGDSQGVCSETDLETEMAGNRAAFAALQHHPWVDPTRIVAMGQSFAGGLLPLVAPAAETRGYLFINSWTRTWLERLLEFERLRLEASGLSPGVVSARMSGLAELYALVLEGGLMPAEAFRLRPALAGVWDGEPTHQYGRPIRFMQQLQATNVAAAWEKVDKPTLAVFGEADIVMHRADHERVVGFVNRNRPGAARLVTVPGMDHGMDAPLPGGGRGLPDAVAVTVLDWLKTTLQIR